MSYKNKLDKKQYMKLSFKRKPVRYNCPPLCSKCLKVHDPKEQCVTLTMLNVGYADLVFFI